MKSKRNGCLYAEKDEERNQITSNYITIAIRR